MSETSKNWELQIIAPEQICTDLAWAEEFNIVIAVVMERDHELVPLERAHWAHEMLYSIADQHDLRWFGQHAEISMRDPEGSVVFRPLIRKREPYTTAEPGGEPERLEFNPLRLSPSYLLDLLSSRRVSA
jgi:hypothetical protein